MPDDADDPDGAGAQENATDPNGAQDDRDFEFLVESRLTEFATYLTDLTETEDGYELTYESLAADDTGVVPHREVGQVVNVFRDVEDEPVTIHATVTDLDGTPLGEWHVERDWLAKLEDGDLSEVEFSQTVVDTIEPV